MTTYFDHNATTPIHPDVVDAMMPYLQHAFGNPSCLYKIGVNAAFAVEKARMQTASLIRADESEIIFTSGGTESDNLAIKGAVFATKKRHIITSAIEHPAVLKTCHFLETYFDCELTYIPVDQDGRINPPDVEQAIRPDTALVSIMTVNNETGSIQPIEEITAITKKHGVLFHTDAVQAGGRLNINVQQEGIDLLSLSGHKMYGPKGVGALYVRSGVSLVAQNNGGGQEQGLRGGTENVPAIVGMGKAAHLAKTQLSQRTKHVSRISELMWNSLSSTSLHISRISSKQNCLPGTLTIAIDGVLARDLVRAMDRQGFCIAAGSACATGKTTPSHVLKAMGFSEEVANSSIRLSFGVDNTPEDVVRFVEVLFSLDMLKKRD